MTPRKTDFPLDQCRCHLETGPIVLVGSQWQAEHSLMVMGWHMDARLHTGTFERYGRNVDTYKKTALRGGFFQG
ncbi:hypothetical protein [Chromohalobacter canadensis]|uniref:hypothetical protein n=1 Tax=Chromohalobacter canadensis TaxID=141389 RepID=UPI00240FA278|nr:hypothetical protein [Chromohalobacter canadensis]